MGLFHKDLDDLDKVLKKGKNKEAIEIIEKHLEDFDELFKLIPEFNALSNDYAQNLRLARKTLSGSGPMGQRFTPVAGGGVTVEHNLELAKAKAEKMEEKLKKLKKYAERLE